ncbi:MIR motif-containing protein [Fimicolochytrium jonesii]|uniref:MIR motif-containing protein n=1 Tax=Fimicolochytrium jonesii TaxID=1396493 RepID=UPI0022FDDD8C|nr:MIR motif-containing protein [Fimicolochytrium jonesii]KAI8827000.1 MIR motif-containing protein [Fimicolochytrium jonesii]
MRSAVVAAAVLSIVSAVAAEQHAFVIEDEFKHVACSSAVKLTNKGIECRLNSLSVNYGTGSGQQAVTCLPRGDDPSSYFLVQSPYGQPDCTRKTRIECGSVFRLLHLVTKKYLHSHAAHRSPHSKNQEVSAFDGVDKGDDWKLVCVNSAEKFWTRESPVRLQHLETGKYLSVTAGNTYNIKPPGQMEVSAASSTGNDQTWIAQEGIYFGNSD